MIHVYDIETLPNIFCLVAKDINTKQIHTFEISYRLNQVDRLIKYLSSPGLKHIGYNNLAFDYPVIHWLLNNYYKYKNTDELILAIHNYANYIISLEYSAVRDRDVKIPQLDLYKIWHFDNKAKATSLKALEIAMRMETVQDLPFGNKEEVPLEYFNDVINYCINDVDATHKFYLESKNEIILRQDLSKEHDLDLINANDPKIGEQIFLSKLATEMNINKWDLKKMRTYVDKLEFNKYILDIIKFQTPELNTLLNKIKSFTTTDTKGSFHYSAKLGDFTIDYGQGGLHGCIEPGVYESDENKVILDLDVASFYPNLAIVNNIRPRHLGEAFSNIYKDMYFKRKSIPKSDSRNYGLKIALNGSFG